MRDDQSETLEIINGMYNSIGLVGRMFTHGPGDMASIPDRVIEKT